MATRGAIGTGNWSASGTWDGGLGVPVSGDTVVANNFTVTIDQDVTVGTIQTLASGAFASGGGFACSSARTINANILAGTTNCLTVTGSSNLNINGNSTASAASSAKHGCSWGSSATLTFIGNATGGGLGAGYGLNITNGTVIFTGDATGGAGISSNGITTVTTLTYVSGTITGGSNSGEGLNIQGGTVTITSATLTAGTAAAIDINTASTVTFSGPVGNLSASQYAITIASASTITFNGAVTATVGKFPVINCSGGVAPSLTFNSSVVAADGVMVVRAQSLDMSVTICGTMTYSANGTCPFHNSGSSTASMRLIIHLTNNVSITIPASSGTRTLSTPGPIGHSMIVRNIGTY